MYITHRAEWSAPALTSVRRTQDAFPQTVATRCPCSARSACGGCPLTHLAQSPVPACATRLPAALRSAVEGLSGLSLSGVRVHYNSALPARFQALAFTQGMHIYLAAGQEEHLGHEAWHVVQQLQGRVSVVGPDGVNHDPVLEAEAEAMGRLAMGRLAVGRLAAGNEAGDAGTRPGRRPVVGRLLAAGRTAPIQLRGANPYAAGGGITSHHVIPHSLLVEMRGMLSPADQATTQAMFLPDFGKLTVATLLEAAITDTVGEPLAIAFNSQQRSKTHITNNNPPGFQVLAQTPFAGLTSAERGALTFDDAPFATFEAR